ncbi:outer membrane protein, OmpA/MotB family [hydrothermal vent metagenome]|uniref:Outer membrane protein, OmpA/MotB family n=1 Tax=hydrothermal vent metagenome TaxID=652676 RepID=A0A1W1BZJ8_9ZZZZ
MNAINVIIGGLISSIFFIFLCISLNAEQYYKELNVHHHIENIRVVRIKPNIILRDRSSQNTTKIKIINPVEYKPILVKEANCTCIEHKKEENISIEKISAVKEPLSEEPSVYLLSDSNVSDDNISDTNLSLSNMLLKNIQDKIYTLLHDRQITFKKNSGKLSREGRDILDKLLILLSDQKGFTIEVQGHTDAGGKAKVNQWISQMRANRVKKYLIQNGISSKNIKAKGFGESKLLFLDRPYNQKNRRVEIYIKRRKNARIDD